MATGIIDSITSDNGGIKSGVVKSDETGDLINFTNQSIACGVLDDVDFDIVVNKTNSYADNLTCSGGVVDYPGSPIRTSENQDYTVSENQKLVIKGNGHVTGNITINGGKLKVVGDGIVTGKITINKSGTVVVSGGTITGDIDVEEGELVKINGDGIVTGNITINKGYRMVLDGGTINGTLDVNDTYKINIKSDSKIGC